MREQLLVEVMVLDKLLSHCMMGLVGGWPRGCHI